MRSLLSIKDGRHVLAQVSSVRSLVTGCDLNKGPQEHLRGVCWSRQNSGRALARFVPLHVSSMVINRDIIFLMDISSVEDPA
jgi:hypothetical protein